MKRVVLAVGLLAVGGAATAGPMDDARLALHRKDTWSSKVVLNLCNDATDPSVINYSPNFDGIPCTDYTVTGPVASGSTVFLVLGQAGSIGVGGVSFGVNYAGTNGVGIDPRFTDWTSCTDGLEFPNDGGNGAFPKARGGIRITWSTCQRQEVGGVGVHAVVGAFYVYVYSEDVLHITPNNNLVSGPELAITACGGATTDLLTLIAPSLVDDATGHIHFGGNGLQGYTPCGVVPVKATTWGKIKTQY